MNALMKLIITASIFFTYSSFAIDLSKIDEFRIQSENASKLSLELTHGLAKLDKLGLENCTPVGFDPKFQAYFTARQIYTELVGSKELGFAINVNNCTPDNLNQIRLKKIIQNFEIDSQVKKELYLAALKSVSVNNKEAEKILLKYEKDQSDQIKKLEAEVEEARVTGRSANLKKILFTALVAVGFLALGFGVIGGIIGLGFFFFSASHPIYLLVTAIIVGLSSPSLINKSTKELTELEVQQIEVQKIREDINRRRDAIKLSAEFRDALSAAYGRPKLY